MYSPSQEHITSFFAKVIKSDDGCWTWTGSKNHKGYGLFRVRDKGISVHRLAYEIAYGPIPDGLWVCHHCDNRACVRPDHLFLGTPSDNTRDAMAKGRWSPPSLPRGEDHPAAHLSNEHVRAIRRLYKTGDYTQRELGERFDVHACTISRIVNRRRRDHD